MMVVVSAKTGAHYATRTGLWNMGRRLRGDDKFALVRPTNCEVMLLIRKSSLVAGTNRRCSNARREKKTAPFDIVSWKENASGVSADRA
jgi:hypothetical protein